MKSKTQIFKQKPNGIVISKFNSSLYKMKENIKENDYKIQINNYYLKFKNTQSLSTWVDDIKNNEIKDSLSMKNHIPFNILNNFSYINEINSYFKLSFDLFQKQVNMKYINVREKKFENNLILKIENDKNNYNDIKNTTPENIKLKNDINKNIKKLNNIVLNNNNKKIDQNNKNINDKKKNKIIKLLQDDIIKNNNNNNNFLYKKELLKSFPPKISNLYDKRYILEQSVCKYFINNNSYKKLNPSEVPNFLYNHIMIKNNKTKHENKKFNSISIVNRIKGKLLTIFYYSPI